MTRRKRQAENPRLFQVHASQPEAIRFWGKRIAQLSTRCEKHPLSERWYEVLLCRLLPIPALSKSQGILRRQPGQDGDYLLVLSYQSSIHGDFEQEYPRTWVQCHDSLAAVEQALNDFDYFAAVDINYAGDGFLSLISMNEQVDAELRACWQALPARFMEMARSALAE